MGISGWTDICKHIMPARCPDNKEALLENLHLTSSSQIIMITMAVLRLRPLVRFSKCTIPNFKVCHSYSKFSTVAFHQLQHPAPASTSNRFLPRFMDPSIYWRGSKSVSKIKGSQGPKPWNPATFYIVR